MPGTQVGRRVRGAGSARDSGVGVSSGYSIANSAGTGLPPRAPVAAAEDVSPASRRAASRLPQRQNDAAAGMRTRKGDEGESSQARLFGRPESASRRNNADKSVTRALSNLSVKDSSKRVLKKSGSDLDLVDREGGGRGSRAWNLSATESPAPSSLHRIIGGDGRAYDTLGRDPRRQRSGSGRAAARYAEISSSSSEEGTPRAQRGGGGGRADSAMSSARTRSEREGGSRGGREEGGRGEREGGGREESSGRHASRHCPSATSLGHVRPDSGVQGRRGDRERESERERRKERREREERGQRSEGKSEGRRDRDVADAVGSEVGRRVGRRMGVGGAAGDREWSWGDYVGEEWLRSVGDPRAQNPRALVGMANIGNTCFMNSCIQCLSNTVPLSGYFMSERFHKELAAQSRGAQLTEDYAALTRDLWEGKKGGSINPAALKMQISRWAKQFSGTNQHDSQELLRFLLDGMQDAVLKPKHDPPWPYDDDDFDKLPVPEQAQRMWDNFLARNDSFVSRLFCGQLHSCVRCSACGRESNCYDPFMDLSLPIPKRFQASKTLGFGDKEKDCDLTDCFDQFVEEERLQGRDEYYCARCKKHQEASKRMTVFRFPPVLVVHLKRFDKRSYSRTKMGTRVRFPLDNLDLRSYAARGSPAEQDATYSLYGITHHSGNMDGGHYIAHCKNYDDKKWYCYNDSRVTPVNGSPPIDSSAYLLFYSRINPGRSRLDSI